MRRSCKEDREKRGQQQVSAKERLVHEARAVVYKGLRLLDLRLLVERISRVCDQGPVQLELRVFGLLLELYLIITDLGL